MRAYLSDGDARARANSAGLLPSWARELREGERAISEAARIMGDAEQPTSEAGFVPLSRLDAVQVYESKGLGLGAAVASNAHVALVDCLAWFCVGRTLEEALTLARGGTTCGYCGGPGAAGAAGLCMACDRLADERGETL